MDTNLLEPKSLAIILEPSYIYIMQDIYGLHHWDFNILFFLIFLFTSNKTCLKITGLDVYYI